MDTKTIIVDSAVQYGKLVIIPLALLAISILVILLLRLIFNRLYQLKRKTIWLEITPPLTVSKTPEATEQLFSVFHGLRAARSVKDKTLGRLPVFSFEIVSTRKTGIRYLVNVESNRASSIQKAITAYIPDSKVKEIDRNHTAIDRVIEFKQKNHYVLPLTLTSAIEQHDPLSYITGAMTMLKDDEEITLQLVVTPIRLREAEILSHKILDNENILKEVSSLNIPGLKKPLSALGKLSSGLTDLASEVYAGTTSSYKEHLNSSNYKAKQQELIIDYSRPSRTLSAFELELMETMHRKVTQPLFRVNIRILIKSHDVHKHTESLRSALDGYSIPPYQYLKAKVMLPIIQQFKKRLAIKRLPSLFRRTSLILSTSELSSLFHFPPSQFGKTDNLIRSLSRTLPAPVSLKSGQKLSVLIGENHHHGEVTPIGLTEAERERHMYVIGGTGNGKTTMLFYQIIQDIQHGKGVAVIDPHGDLAERILRYIPEERINDVVYINPDDLGFPVGMNLLELTPNLDGDDLLREKDLITEAAISVLRKIFSEDDSGGHRIEYILRNTIQTALTLEEPTLFTIFELLNDAKYRRKVVRGLSDKNLKDFWNNELGKAGDMQKVKMAAGITAKVGRFLFSASARRIIEQPKSTINFENILAKRKILICNFSKGLLGEDTSALFGTTVLAKLQTASLRRARLSEDNRTPYYLYVDEFQNFATMSFVQMLSESRKYKLFLIMAEQSTSQHNEQRLVDIILANVGTVICFRSGSPSDERLTLPLFMPFIEQGEIANLPAYSFYARISAVQAQEPMSGMTVVVDSPGSADIAKQVVVNSRKLYAKKVEEKPPEVTVTSDVAQNPTKKVPKKKPKTKKRKMMADDLASIKSVT